ncbi:hypothetical protein NN4_14770 [Nocardia ninae NBRC 108245]|uniref:Uncharacterized protein n=1 Tax=Nocardia ninae NBRC 108245 TaxID=1210091 RepID=A0A511MA29_9NOCA|nr:hypothetical protein NN4_14770 [Nocardia ninae NBRC 108245]
MLTHLVRQPLPLDALLRRRRARVFPYRTALTHPTHISAAHRHPPALFPHVAALDMQLSRAGCQTGRVRVKGWVRRCSRVPRR